MAMAARDGDSRRDPSQAGCERLLNLRPVVGVDGGARASGAALHLGERRAQNALMGGAVVEYGPIQPQDRNEIAAVFGERAEPLLAGAARLLGLRSLGHIGRDADRA